MRPFGSPTASDSDCEEEFALRRRFLVRARIRRLRARCERLIAARRALAEAQAEAEAEAEAESLPGSATLSLAELPLTTVGGDGSHKLIWSFEEADLPPRLLENLRNMKITSPTAIQRVTVPLIMEKQKYDIVAEAETGSGKTIAYLLPIISLIHKIKERQQVDLDRKRPRPYAIVIVPRRELAMQVWNEARNLVKEFDVTIAVRYGQQKGGEKNLSSGCDVLVSTPGCLQDLVTSTRIDLGHLQWTVLDEADDFYRPPRNQIEFILAHLMKKQRHQRRLYAFTATFTLGAVEWLNMFMSSTPFEVHSESIIPKSIEHRIRILPSQCEFRFTLLHDLSRIKAERGGTMPKTIVFTNKTTRCYFVASFLGMNGFRAEPFVGECPPATRDDVLRMFSSGELDIIVSANLMERGIHIPGIQFVFNYDFPSRGADALHHRIGRIGRDGIGTGCAYTYLDRSNAFKFESQLAAAESALGVPTPEDEEYSYEP